MARQIWALAEALEKRFLFASAVVNWNDVRQTIDGFGASTAWFSGTIPSAAFENIFNPNTGAGLTLLRSRVQPSGGSSEWQMMQQVAKYGVRVWSTPWTQPREWKTNHDTNNGGNLLASHYQDYANHLADYVQDMTAKGIPMYAVSIQNEPNWQPDYESTIWSAQQFAAFLPYIGQTFASRGITTKIMLPESLNWNFSLAGTIMADPNLAQYVGILAAHNYGETANSYQPVSIANGKPVWMTEVSSSVTSSEIGTAVDMADDIHQAMADANASAYHYWWLSTNSFAGGLTTGTWAATKRLWAMGNYSRFIRPGWVRIGTTDDGGLDVTTFKDPQSGKFAIVVVNTNATNAVTEQFNLSGVTAGSVTPYITSAADNLVQYSPVTLTNGTTFSQTIAPNSVVTYYGVSATAPTLQPPGNLRVTPPYGATNSQLALSWSDNSTTETGYTIERSLDGTNWTVVNSTLPANTNFYTDTGLAENTKYHYRVKAQDSTTSSAYSAIASYITTLVAPTGLTGTAVTGGIRLNWTVSSAASTGVSVFRSLDGVTWTNIANLNTRATTYTDTINGYDANQAYYYRIRNTAGDVALMKSTRLPRAGAVAAAQGGAFSTFTTWNTGLKAPTNFASSRLTGRSVTLSWTNVAVSASGAWIEQQTGTSTTWTRISATSLEPSAGTLQVGGLTPGTTYRFRLRVSAAADSVYSAWTSTLTVNTPASNGLPIAWLKADEAAGSTLLDSSNNYNDGTLTGSYSFVTGKTGNAVRFSGGYASLPNGVVAGLNDFTVATWINPTSSTSWMRIFEFATSNTNSMFLTTRAGDTGLPRFGINVNGSAQQRVDSSIAIPLNTWTHVAVTLSGNTATLYINGVAAGTNTAMTLRPAGLGQTSQNYLGKSINSWDPTLSASIDDFRVYDKALTSDEVRALTATTLPQPWVQADIGSPALAGSASFNSTGGVWTVAGSGSDIWNTADQFQFVSQSASGDFALVARVTSLSNTDLWAKAGVMIRESSAANAAYAFVGVRPDGQVMFQYRRTAGGSAENSAIYGGTGTVRYVKIERTAGMITGYYSSDGLNWTATGPAAYVYMPRAVITGLAVTSHNTAQVATATLDNVRLGAAVVVGSVSVNTGAAQRSRLTGVSVAFSAPVTPAAGAFLLTRRADGQSFAVTASNPSGDGMTFLLSFTGSGTESGSLPDGLYDLTVQGALVRDTLGQTLAGGNYRYSLSRLFGDINGDNFVNTTDQAQFNATLNGGAYNAAFDINADNQINSIDAAAFNSRFATSLPVAGLPSSIAWTSSGPLISAPVDATHTNAVSVKDPTVVFYNNKWYVFATWANTSGNWSMVYYSFTDWSQAATAKPLFIDTIPGMTGYKCAPKVFFMRPLNKWVLVFQGADPQYTLMDDIEHPEQMSAPKSLFYKFPANSSGWIDFDLIADDRYLYLFYTKDNGEFWRSRTRLEDFPNGFDEPTLVMSRPTSAEMFEGSQTYKIAGTNKYLTIIEAFSNSGGRRYFTSYMADRLDGTWTSVGTSYTNPFAALTNVTFPAGTPAWSDNFSHGDLIRSTYDETMTIDPANLQLLYQGLDGSKVPAGTDYSQLPWQLGLLTLTNKNAPTNVTATAGSSTQVNLAWNDRSTSEAGYLVERSTNAAFTTNVTRFTVGAGTTAYADTSVSANTTYYYRITTLMAGAVMDGTATAPAVTTPSVVAPVLANYQIDDGTAQRSMIRTITLTFDQPVAMDAADLVLKLDGAAVSNVAVGLSSVSGLATQYVLTFGGTGTTAGSLKDGRYELVLNGVSISNASGTTMNTNPSFSFYRLFGDADGNRTVDFNDFLRLQNAYNSTSGSANFVAGLDSDSNSVIDFNDFLVMQNNFGLVY